MEQQRKNCVKERFKELNTTPEYQAKNDIARHAISELSNIEQESIVSKEQCVNWLNRYKFFHKNFNGRGPLFYPTLWEFYCLYNDVKMYMDCLFLNKQQISNALKEFKAINLECEASISKWLVANETLNCNMPYFKKSEKNNYIYISEKFSIIISSVDFSNAIDFQNEFIIYYKNII